MLEFKATVYRTALNFYALSRVRLSGQSLMAGGSASD